MRCLHFKGRGRLSTGLPLFGTMALLLPFPILRAGFAGNNSQFSFCFVLIPNPSRHTHRCVCDSPPVTRGPHLCGPGRVACWREEWALSDGQQEPKAGERVRVRAGDRAARLQAGQLEAGVSVSCGPGDSLLKLCSQPLTTANFRHIFTPLGSSSWQRS